MVTRRHSTCVANGKDMRLPPRYWLGIIASQKQSLLEHLEHYRHRHLNLRNCDVLDFYQKSQRLVMLLDHLGIFYIIVPLLIERQDILGMVYLCQCRAVTFIESKCVSRSIRIMKKF